MEYTRATWNENHKILRELLKKESTFKNAVSLFMDQHARVHSSDVSGIECMTFEDELWDGMDEITFRTGQNKKGRTVENEKMKKSFTRTISRHRSLNRIFRIK